MKRERRLSSIMFLLPLLAVLLACCKGKRGEKSLTLCSWNVQTFFDAVDDGTEYSEFRGGKTKWSETAYKERLGRLCRAMKAIDADVYAFMEIENEGVIRDIDNTLPTLEWGKSPWQYAAFKKEEGTAFGCAVLSRFPLSGVAAHSIDIRTSGEQPPLRPIVSVQIMAGKKVTLIINHWKSKVGGESGTDYWRDWQEGVLASLFLQNENTPVVACGDFNRDIADFDTDSGMVTLHGIFGEGDAAVASAWSMAGKGGTESAPGSYYYKDRWERIDCIFANSLVNINLFAALCKGEWATDDGKPRRYTLRNRQGYADHLPIMAEISY